MAAYNLYAKATSTNNSSATIHERLLLPRQVSPTSGKNQYDFTQAFSVTVAGRFVFSVDARKGPANGTLGDGPTCVLTICIASLPCSVSKPVKAGWSTFSSTSYLSAGQQSVLFTVGCADVAYVGFKNIKIPGQLIVAPVTQTVVSTAPAITLPQATRTDIFTLVSELPPATSIISFPQATATETVITQLDAVTTTLTLPQLIRTETTIVFPDVPIVSTPTPVIFTNDLCPNGNGQRYTDRNGVKYDLYCGYDADADGYSVASHPNFESCLVACDIDPRCEAVSFNPETSGCSYKSNFRGTFSAGPNMNLARKVIFVASGDPTTTSQVASTDSTLSSSPSPAAVSLCPGADGTTYTDGYGIRYDISCGQDVDADEYANEYARDFLSCLTLCDLDPRCEAITYNAYISLCFYKSSVVGTSPTADFVYLARKVVLVPQASLSVSSTSTTSVPVSTVSSSTTAATPICPGAHASFYTDQAGKQYQIACDFGISGQLYQTTTTSDFGGCLAVCGQDLRCKAATFLRNHTTSNCFLKTEESYPYFYYEFGADTALMFDPGVPTTTQTTSSTTGSSITGLLSPSSTSDSSITSSSSFASSSDSSSSASSTLSSDSSSLSSSSLSSSYSSSSGSIPAPSPTTLCPSLNGTRFANGAGGKYDIYCGFLPRGYEYGFQPQTTFEQCLPLCDQDPKCEAVAWNTGTNRCYFDSQFRGFIPGYSNVYVASRVDFFSQTVTTTRTTTSTTVMSTTTTSTTKTTTTTTTSSTAAATPPACPADNNKVFTSGRGNRFTVLCYKDLYDPNPEVHVVTMNLADCINQCDTYNNGQCKGVSWVPQGQDQMWCYYKPASATVINQTGGVVVFSAKLTSLLPVT